MRSHAMPAAASTQAGFQAASCRCVQTCCRGWRGSCSRAPASRLAGLSPAEALAALGDAARARRLFGELGVEVRASGLFVEGAPGLVGLRVEVDESGHARRGATSRAVGRHGAGTDPWCRRPQEVSRWRSKFKLLLLASRRAYKPSAVADPTLSPATVESAPQVYSSPPSPSGRQGSTPAAALGGCSSTAANRPPPPLGPPPPGAPIQCGNAFGLVPRRRMRRRAAVAQLAPDVSASNFPIKF